MSVWRLLVREIFHNKLNFLLGLLAVVVAAGCVLGSQLYLKQFGRHNENLDDDGERRLKKTLKRMENERDADMTKLKDKIWKATKGAGFTLTILHKDVDRVLFDTEDETDKYLPEDYADRLAKSKILTINHLLPILQKRVQWKELDGRTVLFIGTKGEVKFKDRKAKKAFKERVPPGTIVLGNELFRSLNRVPGRRFPLVVGRDEITLLGKKLKIHAVQDPQGNSDDSVAFINLGDAQELFDKKGQISGIFAVGCDCEANRLATIRRDVTKHLPDAMVFENVEKGRPRADARLVTAEAIQADYERSQKREKEMLDQDKDGRAKAVESRQRLFWFVNPLVVVACAVGLAVVVFTNVRQRRSEIGILRAIGLGSRDLFLLFTGKTVLIGLLGALIGTSMGWLLASLFAPGTGSALFEPWLFAATVGGALVVCCLVTGVPSMLAAREDPAVVLSEE